MSAVELTLCKRIEQLPVTPKCLLHGMVVLGGNGLRSILALTQRNRGIDSGIKPWRFWLAKASVF